MEQKDNNEYKDAQIISVSITKRSLHISIVTIDTIVNSYEQLLLQYLQGMEKEKDH